MHYYPLVTGDSSTLLSIWDNDTLPNDGILYRVLSYSLRYSYAMLSVNGTSLSSSQGKFNFSQTLIGSNILTKEINFQYDASDEGFYNHFLSIYYFYIEDQLIYDRYILYPRCRCRDYSSHIAYALGIRIMSLSAQTFILQTYSKYSF